MLLTSSLAQQIVDNIMPIAQHNINIMDNQGIIIGSGQKNRLASFHLGAQDAIRSCQTIEIYPNNLDQYSGSYPGLNMPIVLHDQVIGVVGITGHPDEVRDMARMVKMVTELILEQEVLLEEARSQHQLKENFATLLLSDNAGTHYSKLANTAKLLKYDLHLPRLVVVLDIQPLLNSAFENFGHNDLVAARARETALQLIDKPPYMGPQDLAVFIEDKLLVLKHFPADTSEQHCTTWGASLLSLFHANSQSPVNIGLGSLASAYTGLGHSYQEALFALKHFNSADIIPTIYDFDILASYLLGKIDKEADCQPVQRLKAKLHTGLAKKYDMKATVVSLLHNNLNLTSTAKSLYIHRNTLLFRLAKLKEATGLDPCRFLNHAFLCKILFED